MESLILLFALLFFPVNSAAADHPPDAIFLNGDIYTQATPARAQAMAVRDGRIVAIGSNDEIRKLKGQHTKVVDLGGHFVMPGFNDAHLHLADGGLVHFDVDLAGSAVAGRDAAAHRRAREDHCAGRVGAWAAAGTTRCGRASKLPTRQDIDAVTGDHPAILGRVDGHIAVANTAALKAAGMTGNTPDPQGGKIDHDASGEPTGIMREDRAGTWCWSKIPPPIAGAAPPRHRVRAGQRRALGHHLGAGQFRLGRFPGLRRIGARRQADAAHQRVARLQRAARRCCKSTARTIPPTDPMLHTAMLKGFMDGSLGSRTAALLAPYSDDPGNSGLPRYRAGQAERMAIERAAAGFQIGFHAIGDRAAQMALDAFAAGRAQFAAARTIRRATSASASSTTR